MRGSKEWSYRICRRRCHPRQSHGGELYERFAQKEGLRWKTIQELVSEAKAFLDPVLASDVADGSWDPEQHAWVR